MLAVLWLAYSSFGLVSGGLPPLVGPVSDALGLSRFAIGSVLGAWPLVYIVTAIPAGALIDRHGLRRSLAVGVLLIAISGLLRAVAVNYITMFIAVAVFGLGGPFISIGAPKLIAVWFNRRDQRTAMGIYMTASPIGRIAALATANSMLMPLFRQNWRLTLATYAGITAIAGVIWYLLARDARPAGGSRPQEKESLAATMKVFPLLLKGRVVQIIMILSIGSFLFNHGFMNWLPEILRDTGMSATQAGFWSTVPIVVGIGATFIIPLIAGPRYRIPILVGIFLAAGISSLVVATTTGAPMTLGLLLQGIAGRGAQPIIILILLEAPQVGSEHMGAAAGLYYTAGEIGGVLGPLLLGVLADQTGGFVIGLVFIAGLCVILAMLTLTLGLALRTSSPTIVATPGHRSEGSSV